MRSGVCPGVSVAVFVVSHSSQKSTKGLRRAVSSHHGVYAGQRPKYDAISTTLEVKGD